MAPIAKENEILSITPETAPRPSATASLPADNAVKQQPVALEVAVSVNGARTVEGSDKREPFSETTKTVLVFGGGAVIRLASSVTAGQLLFLTNEKTKKEVVCQVVKSKNYRNVSGYVELEFTEPVVGFWGMRFPSDRLGSAPQPVVTGPAAVGSPAANGAPVAPRPVAPRIETPAANLALKVAEQKPAAPAVVARNSEPKLAESKFVAPPAPVSAVPVAAKPEAPVAQLPATPASLMPELAVIAPPVKPVAPLSSTFDLPRTPDSRASIFAAPPQVSAAPPALDAGSVFPAPEANPPALGSPQASSASDPETEALKQHTARLQEQLSSMLFMDTPSAKPAQNPPAAKVVENAKLVDAASKVLEFAKNEPSPSPVRHADPAKTTPPPGKSLLDEEELKIPSWLEPLARNAAAPASTQELIEREKAKRVAEQFSVEEIASEPAGVVEEDGAFELPGPNFGGELSFDAGENTIESGSRTSGKRMWIAAIAAGALLAGGGSVWYFRQQSGGDVHAGSAVTRQAPAVSLPAATLPPQGNAALQTAPAAQTALAVQSSSPLQTSANLVPSGVDPAGAALAQVNSKQVIPNPAKGGPSFADSASPLPVAAQPKKPSLGEVRLATPKVTQRGNAQVGGEAEAGLAIGGETPESSAGALGAGLAASSSQPAAPAAPLPVGGDVKQARLIASVPPVYPALAKNQHVSGDVRIDAVIDPNGRVTTMKVVSGPTLLHQAAMDALRQWKYQPASLNGGPVQMHLTVTIQFRLQ